MSKTHKASAAPAPESVADNAAEAISPARKIAILGNATTSVHDAPYADDSWKIWDMSANFQYGRRYDLFFELHTPEVLQAYNKEHMTKYFPFLKGAGKALIAGHPSEEWPDATLFPLTEMLGWLKDNNAKYDYFTCSAAYMIAYALYLSEMDKANGGKGVEKIGLWGIDMAVGEEYGYQKPCIEYWIGFLMGRGIDVYIAPQSPVCRTNALYAFENLKLSREFTEKLQELKSRIAQEEAEFNRRNLTLLELRASERALKEISDRWML